MEQASAARAASAAQHRALLDLKAIENLNRVRIAKLRNTVAALVEYALGAALPAHAHSYSRGGTGSAAGAGSGTGVAASSAGVASPLARQRLRFEIDASGEDADLLELLAKHDEVNSGTAIQSLRLTVMHAVPPR